MSKFKSSLSHSTSKEIWDLYRLAATKPMPHEKALWNILTFMELGYYFSDSDYRIVSNEIIEYSHDLFANNNLNIRLVEKLIKALKCNKDRFPQEEILLFAMEIFKKKYYRFFDPIFDLLGTLYYLELSNESINGLIFQIKTILENKEISQKFQNIEGVFIRLRKNRNDFSNEIDEIVEKYYPDFYKNDYHLEIFPDERSIHIKRFLDAIKHRNKTQGKNGIYTVYANNPYLTIKNIFEFENSSISEELFTDLLKELVNTLLSEIQAYTEKIDSIQLLLFLKRHDSNQRDDWKKIYSDLIQNISKVEKGRVDFFDHDNVILLQFCLIFLRISFGEECSQELLEILAQISNSQNSTIINSLIYLNDFLKDEENNLANTPILPLVIQYISAFCLHEDNDIRYRTVLILYQLINTQYSNFIINRLVKMIDDYDFSVKWAIVNQVDLIKQHDVISSSYILGRARIDNNYLVRKKANTK